jgi:hypothetical protein
MASAITRYPGSSVVTETNAPGYSGGNDDLLNFYNEMARRRTATSRGGPRPEKFSLGARKTAAPGGGPGREGDRSGALKNKILEAAASKASSEAKALSSRIPTRMSTVGGQSFATPDHLAMTGAQRQAFLPQNAGMEAGGLSPMDALKLRTGSSFGAPVGLGGEAGGFKTVFGAANLPDEFSPDADPDFQAFLQYQARQRRGQ